MSFLKPLEATPMKATLTEAMPTEASSYLAWKATTGSGATLRNERHR